MMADVVLRDLQEEDIPLIAAAFEELGWNKPASQYQKYLEEQKTGQRKVIIAWCGGVFAGYVTLCRESEYPGFVNECIPEIVDLNVLPVFRRRGIGSRLLDEAERQASQISAVVGIGVGMTVDYGAAQRMYVTRGYLPDACGLMQAGKPIGYGQVVRVDDDLCLYFKKKLRE